MQVKTIMTSPAISIEPTETIMTAIRLMLAHKISGLPVVTSKGELVGIVTESDLIHRSELETEGEHSWLAGLFRSAGNYAAEYAHTHGRKVADVMSNAPVSIAPDASLRDAVEAMTRQRVKRLPVVKNDHVVGIVARADILRALLPAIADASKVDDDESIRQAILREYQNQDRWAGRNLINVHVKNGIVELTGVVMDEPLRTAARVAAENVPGVVSVIDNITFSEPLSDTIIPPPMFP